MPPVKDFDKELARTARLKPPAERTFRINGNEFVHRPSVAPEVVADYMAFRQEDGEARLVEILDRTIQDVLEPESSSRWMAARDPNAEIPITAWDMLQIVHWLVAVVSGRPTEESNDSSPSSPPNGTPSTDSSGDRPVVAFGG